MQLEKLSIPEEYKKYIEYVRNLKFSEEPNYEYLKNLFVEVLKREKISFDLKQDWDQVKQCDNLI